MNSLRRACHVHLSVLGVGLLTGASAARAQDGMPYVLFGEPETWFGTTVATGGDVNRDEHPDIFVAAPEGYYLGNWSIYSGADGSLLGTGEPSAGTVRARMNAEFIGDVNSDGRDDFVIGAGMGWSMGVPTLPGLVEVRSGRNGATIWSYIPDDVSDQIGCDVSGGGDLTGDGISDVVAAGPEDLGGRVRAFDGTNGQILLDVPFDYVRRAIFAGDLNADGVVDMLASSPNADLPGPSREVRAISGATGETLWAVQKSFDEGQYFGHTMAMVGDLDGDLVPDVAASQPRPRISQDQGVLIFSGRTGALIRFIPLAAADDGPWDLVVGDFNGDGTNELIMYATSGEARAIGADLSTATTLYTVASRPTVATLTGNELVTADFNRDGFDDVVLGASDVPRVDVLSGSRLRLDMLNGGFTRHGDRRDVYIRSATPNSRVIVAASFAGNGRTFIPPLNFTIDLSNPFTVIADGHADSTGYVRFILRVPNGTPLGYFWMQAIEIASGGVVTKSNVVQQEVLAD